MVKSNCDDCGKESNESWLHCNDCLKNMRPSDLMKVIRINGTHEIFCAICGKTLGNENGEKSGFEMPDEDIIIKDYEIIYTYLRILEFKEFAKRLREKQEK